MKLALIPVLIALLFTQAFSKWMIVLEYKLNREYIAQNLCINKSKPVLKCKGKCQMMKKLAEEEKQNSTNDNTVKLKIPELVFCDKMDKPVLPSPDYTIVPYSEFPKVREQLPPVFSIFHPPATA